MWDIAAFWAAVLKNPPNPDEPLPLSNRPATIYASNLVFLVLSWMALSFRLWVRFRVVREPGWDDLFVVLASLCNIAGSVCVCLSVQNGLGHHMLYLGLPTVQKYLFLLYLEKSIYMTEATFIKLSLLLQYLRVFKSGIMRLICIVLVVITSLWGLVYFILGWFPCFPIRAAWERTIQATCYGFGYNDPKSFTEIYVSHASSNMALDLIIFVIPLVLFSTPNLNPRNLIAMAGMFLCGAVVVGIAIARLYVIVKYRAGTAPYIDFTWWAPIMIILSVLEIDLAIICASMPIFWPMIEKSLGAIFVSFEVEIVEEHIDEHGLAYELEHRKAREGSIKSGSGVSIQELIRDEELSGGQLGRQYSISKVNAIGVQTAVQSKPKPKWEI